MFLEFATLFFNDHVFTENPELFGKFHNFNFRSPFKCFLAKESFPISLSFPSFEKLFVLAQSKMDILVSKMVSELSVGN